MSGPNQRLYGPQKSANAAGAAQCRAALARARERAAAGRLCGRAECRDGWVPVAGRWEACGVCQVSLVAGGEFDALLRDGGDDVVVGRRR